MKAACLTATICLAFSGCASSGPQSNIGKGEQKPKRIEMTRTSDCVFSSSISGFDTLDDRYVVFYSMGRRKAYLAEIAGGCFDMRYQSTLGAVDGDGNGQICGFGRDSIAFSRMGTVDQCRIMGLQELSDERRLELGVAPPPPKPKKDKDKDKDEKPKDEDENGESR